MRRAKKKIVKAYKAAGGTSKSHIARRPHLLPIAGLIFGGLIVVGIMLSQSGSSQFRPSDSHVVYLYESGQRQTLSTKAETVADLLQNSQIELSQQDIVEPALDTPIVEDNFRVNIYRARPVTVVDGGVKTVTLTARKSARMAAQEAGLDVKAEDIATFAQGDLADNIIGEKVIVSRATPILLNLYGVQLPAYTQAKTVGGLLKEKKIKLSSGESVSPETERRITPGLQVFILRADSQVVVIEETIPVPVQTVADHSLSLGATAIRQNGSPGKKAVTYIESTVGSKTVRQAIGEVIIQEAVPQIIARGTTIDVASDKESVMAAAGIKSGDFGYVNYIISHENALWCPTRWQGQPNCPPTYAEKFPGAETSTSVGYGLGQATPAIKMAPFGADWRTNPITQLKWANNYAVSRYGSWAAAYQHKVSTGWW